jgi:hypothetical protein
MKKQIDLMAQALQQNNLGNFILDGVKKQKEEYLLLRKVIIMIWLQLIPHLIHEL